MGFLHPTVRTGVALPPSDIARLETRARLQKSTGASLLQFAGIALIAIAALTFGTNPLGLAGALAAVVSGGLIWAAGAVTQILWDLRTIALREFDHAENVLLEKAE